MKNLYVNDVFVLGKAKTQYIVTGVAMKGGGTGHGFYDVYPNRRHITARTVIKGYNFDDETTLGEEIEFYEGDEKAKKIGVARTHIVVDAIIKN